MTKEEKIQEVSNLLLRIVFEKPEDISPEDCVLIPYLLNEYVELLEGTV